MAARLKGDSLRVQGADRWYVTDGMNAVGPVRRDLLVRGVAAGKVPLDTFIRHEGWKVWRPLTDFTEADERAVPSQIGAVLGSPPPASSLLALLEEDAEDLSADPDLLIDEKSSEISDRPTIEVMSVAVSTVSPSTLDQSEVPTQVSRDLLGGDRPTLASYLDDDEETIAAGKRPHTPSTSSANASSASSQRVPSAGAPSAGAPSARAPSAGAPSAGAPTVGARSSAAAAAAATVASVPGQTARTPSVSPPPAPSAPVSVAEDHLQGATDFSEAMHLLVGALIRKTGAQVALLHRMADDGATAVCAQGPNMIDWLGARTRLLDPAVVAAAGGSIVVAEPAPGPAGEATCQRLRKSGIDIEGAAMFPIRPRGRLLGMVELGKDRRFDMRELLRAEEIVKAFVKKAEAGGWS